MSEQEHGLRFIISALDTAIKPMQELAKTVDKTVKPVRVLGKELKKAVNTTGIPRLAGSLKGVARELKGATDAATGLVGKLGLMGGGLLGGGLALFKTQLLDVATGNEQLARELQRVTGTADGARDALAWLGQYAQDIGRPVEELTSAFIALRREGVDPQGKAMRQVADLAGHTGASIEEATKAVVDARKGQSDALAELLGARKTQHGNYDVFEFRTVDGSIKKLAALRDKAQDMQALIDRAFELKGIEGGANRMAGSWDGMLGRLLAFKRELAGLVMDSGVFDLIQDKLLGVLDYLDELKQSGELGAMAQEWAAALVNGIESVLRGARTLWAWIQSDLIPGFESVKKFMGGWENMAIALGAVLAGPLVAALAGVANAFIALGAAIGVTPVGWIIAAIAGIAAGAVLIIKNWSRIKSVFSGLWASVRATFANAWQSITGTIQGAWDGISGYFSGKFAAISAAFDQGVIQGIATALSEFHPVALMAEAIGALTEYLFGVNLFDAGARLVSGIWDGVKSVWGSLQAWIFQKWEELTGWLPDKVKDWLGIGGGNKPSPGDGDDKPQGDRPGGGQPGPRPSTGAAAVMDRAGPSGLAAMPSHDQTVRTELVIKAENLPQGMSVHPVGSQADRTSIKCGYAMQGI